MLIRIILLFTFCSSLFITAQNKNFTELPRNKWPEITMINSIEFIDGSFVPSYPGCSFLLDTGKEVLAVTCKHSLWTGKNNKMTSVSFNGQIKNWRMHLKNDTTRYLIVDKLINENKNELISEWNTNNDYLIFTIKENHTGLTPLKLSSKLLTKDSKVFTVGWAFNDHKGPQQIYTSKFIKYLGNAMLVQDSVRQNLAGTSGSPVINLNAELVGIVSSWKFDNSSNTWYAAPCSIDYLWEVLFNYWLDKYNKEKSVENFEQFISHIENINSSEYEISDNVLINIFFYDWLNKNNIDFGELKDFNDWVNKITTAIKRKIQLPEETENQLIFNSWVNQYLSDNGNFNDLNLLIDKGDLFLDWSLLCRLALKLSTLSKFKLSIDIMNYTVEKFPNNGQVYYFFGDLYLNMGDKTSAGNYYKKCLQYYPGYPFAVDKLNLLKE